MRIVRRHGQMVPSFYSSCEVGQRARTQSEKLTGPARRFVDWELERAERRHATHLRNQPSIFHRIVLSPQPVLCVDEDALAIGRHSCAHTSQTIGVPIRGLVLELMDGSDSHSVAHISAPQCCVQLGFGSGRLRHTRHAIRLSRPGGNNSN
jgi:hypothetical protein